jgi:hypothetical protein
MCSGGVAATCSGLTPDVSLDAQSTAPLAVAGLLLCWPWLSHYALELDERICGGRVLSADILSPYSTDPKAYAPGSKMRLYLRAIPIIHSYVREVWSTFRPTPCICSPAISHCSRAFGQKSARTFDSREIFILALFAANRNIIDCLF